jgi:hypothetical protein
VPPGTYTVSSSLRTGPNSCPPRPHCDADDRPDADPRWGRSPSSSTTVDRSTPASGRRARCRAGWDDRNGNGVQDQRTMIEGVEITLTGTDVSNPVERTATTAPTAAGPSPACPRLRVAVTRRRATTAHRSMRATTTTVTATSPLPVLARRTDNHRPWPGVRLLEGVVGRRRPRRPRQRGELRRRARRADPRVGRGPGDVATAAADPVEPSEVITTSTTARTAPTCSRLARGSPGADRG